MASPWKLDKYENIKIVTCNEMGFKNKYKIYQ